MKRKKVTEESEDLIASYINRVQKGIYFANFKRDILAGIIKTAELAELEENEVLLHEGDSTTREMYILLQGSLVVSSKSQFIHRLDTPGDVVGEISIVDPLPRSADVVAEAKTLLLVFTQEAFSFDPSSNSVPIFYLLFSHVLAAKLRFTTAKSIIWKGKSNNADISCNVLVIDENENDSLIIEGALNTILSDVHVKRINKVTEFISKPFKEKIDLIITDPNYDSDSTPEEKLAYLKESLSIHNTPVFFISEYSKDNTIRAEMIRLGAFEILEKPFSIFDLKHAITKFQVHLSRTVKLNQVEQDAETDKLTSLPNRRKLESFLRALVDYYQESKSPFSLLMIDVDNFKHYNDTNGHQMGDVVLAEVARILENNIRKGDLASRFGGEEFVIVLPECQLDNAHALADKVRSKVESFKFPKQELQPNGNLTITVGVANYPKANSINELIEQADQCLYEGKKRGRNIVVQYPFQ